MSVFIGDKAKRVELAERKDIINPNLLTGSKDFTGEWVNIQKNAQKNKYLDFTAICVNWAWYGISQYIAVNKGETYTASMYVKARAGFSIAWYIPLNFDNESGYKKVDANPNGATITATGDWQKVSITFTMLDSGAIKPRIEGDGTAPFWIAGMKLEKGPVATDWCPAWEYAINTLQSTISSGLAGKADKSQVNVDGNLFSSPGSINSWADLQADGQKNVLKSVRTESQATDFDTGNYDAGILFGGLDTKALISVGYEGHTAIVTGGNNSSIWHEDIAWKSDITTLQHQIQAQQTAIETGYMKKPTVISQADYDKLTATDPNTLYEITE